LKRYDFDGLVKKSTNKRHSKKLRMQGARTFLKPLRWRYLEKRDVLIVRRRWTFCEVVNFKYIIYALSLGFVAILAACVSRVERPVTAEKALMKIQSSEFPDFSDDMSYESLRAAINQSLAYLGRLDPSVPFRFGPDLFTAAHLIDSTKAFSGLIGRSLSPEELREAIENSFWVYKSIGRNRDPNVLFTGYYEPILRGSLKESAEYPYPIYRRPDDWVSVDLRLFDPKYGSDRIVGRHVDRTVIPYFSREHTGRWRRTTCQLSL